MNRNTIMDKIRINALFFLISFHFLYYIEFYNAPCIGLQMYVMCVFRALFTACIPLFLLLTGYLMSEKALSKNYYKKCLRTVWIYVLACIVSAVYRWGVGGIVFQPFEFLKSVLNFSACPYGWYVEMYLGLFILIPFLNILYIGVPSQGWKKVLVITMAGLTSLPSLVNVTDFKFIPAWWAAFYPITYYFIGCYIHEYGLRIKRVWNVLAVIVIMLVVGTYTYFNSAAEPFVWSGWSEWNSWANVLMGTLVFGLWMNGRTTTKTCGVEMQVEENVASIAVNRDDSANIENRMAKILMLGSKLAFGAYLLSWIAEDAVYHHIPLNVFEVENRIVFYPVVVVVMIVSLGLSAVVNGVYDVVKRVIRKGK